MRTLVAVLVLTGIVFGAAGCKSKKPQTIDPDFGSTSSTTDDRNTMTRDQTGNIPLSDIDISALPFQPDVHMRRIHFDYDSDVLRADAQATLRENYSYIKDHPELIILVEGHCDERGTQEYNLALGERRALATREYLIRLGANAAQITTLSYGEEAPLAMGSNESAWAQNRRAEFKTAPRP